MTGREAILMFLEKHGYFSDEEVIAATGVSRSQVGCASFKMRKRGEVKLKQRNWRHSIYVANDSHASTSSNVICQECKDSPVMKRILFVYGIGAPA